MTLTGPVTTAPSTAPSTTPTTAPVTEPSGPEVTQPPTAEPTVTTESVTTDASTDTSAASSTSEPVPVSAGADDGDDSRIGTIMFIASVVAILGIGAFVVFRSRQARGRVPDTD
jgi:hypothetical protein